MSEPAEPQAVPIPFDWAQACEWCNGKTVVDSGGNTPWGESIAVRCGYCAGTGLAYPAQRVLHLEAQLRDAEIKLNRVSELLCDSCRINVGMQMDEALRGENAELEVRLVEAERRLEAMQKLVNEQAEDEGLWFNAVHVSEAYLQKALRRLHAVIEGEES